MSLHRLNLAIFLMLTLLWCTSCGQGLCSIDRCESGPSVGGASSIINADGSVTVTITGSGFAKGASVIVNGNICTNVNVLSSTQLTCILPSKSIALTGIVITNPGGTVVAKVTTTGSGTFTVPSGVTSLQIEVWGGGGGGGGNTQDYQATGGGGGGGGYAKKSGIAVTPGQVISYTVGAGGAGGIGVATQSAPEFGTSGQATTALTLRANGGGRGLNTNQTDQQGAGGTASGGDVNITGGVGSGYGGTQFWGGPGGNPYGWNGGNGANGGAGGDGGYHTDQYTDHGAQAGSSPGGGGGGADSLDDGAGHYPALNGATGGNGQIVFTYIAP